MRVWATRIAARRGLRIAAVALVRRVAGVLFSMWRDGTDDPPHRVMPTTPEVAMTILA